MTPTATRVPSDWLRPSTYCCARCGRIVTFPQRQGRRKPSCCLDCTEYLRRDALAAGEAS